MSMCSHTWACVDAFDALHAPVAEAGLAYASKAHVVGSLVVLQLLLRLRKRDVVVTEIDKRGATAVRQAVVR